MERRPSDLAVELPRGMRLQVVHRGRFQFAEVSLMRRLQNPLVWLAVLLALFAVLIGIGRVASRKVTYDREGEPLHSRYTKTKPGLFNPGYMEQTAVLQGSKVLIRTGNDSSIHQATPKYLVIDRIGRPHFTKSSTTDGWKLPFRGPGSTVETRVLLITFNDELVYRIDTPPPEETEEEATSPAD